MEGQAEHLDVEVNGIASQIALGPAPVAVFDEQTGMSGQFVVAGLPLAKKKAMGSRLNS